MRRDIGWVAEVGWRQVRGVQSRVMTGACNTADGANRGKPKASQVIKLVLDLALVTVHDINLDRRCKLRQKI